MVILHLSGPVENSAAAGGESKMASEPVKKVATEDHGDNHPTDKTLPIKKGGFSIMSSTSTNSYAVITPMQARSESTSKPASNVAASNSYEKRGLIMEDNNESVLMKRGLFVPIILRNSAAQLKGSFGSGFQTIKKPASTGWKKVTKQVHKIHRHQQRRAYFHAAEDRWTNRNSPHRSGDWNGEIPTWRE